MTGNIALDVVIGLVFIYLLYSLFATVIMEIITSILGLRARNLRYALRRMLMDEMKFDMVLWGRFCKILNALIKISGYAANLKNNEIFQRFYDQPNVKYLSGGGVSNKPSYLTAQNFSKALIDTLKSFDEEGGSTPLMVVKNGINALPEESDTKKHLESLLTDANNDIARFKYLLEQWFEDTMDQSTGWFKKNVQYILFFIGFIIAVSFNADTLNIIKQLSRDDKARQQLVDIATNYSKENQEVIDYVNAEKKDSNSTHDEKDAIIVARVDSLLSISKSLKNDIYEAQNLIASNWRLSDSVSIEYFDGPDTNMKATDADEKVNKDSVSFVHDLIVEYDSPKGKLDTNLVTIRVHRSIDIAVLKKSIPSTNYKAYKNKKIAVNLSKYKRNYVFAQNGFLKFKHLWGYILTALAISLGAPFWFDLLNKFINLRSSIQPLEQNRRKDNTDTATVSVIERVG